MIEKGKIFRLFDVKRFLNMNKKTQTVLVLCAVLLLVLAIFFSVHVRNRKHDLPAIMESGRLTVLTDSSNIGFSKADGKVTGFQYEMVKAFADSLGLELVISVQNDLKSGIDGLKSGDYDIIASFIPVTTEFKNEALFTIPLRTTRQVLVQRLQDDSTKFKHISKHSQLANDTIYITENSPYKMRLQHLSNEIANPIEIIEIKNTSVEQLVHLVSVGKIKYTICDEQLAQKLMKSYTNIDITLPIGFSQQQAWAVHRRSKNLLNKLNEFLEDFIGSSAYWNIYRKYY